MSTRGEPKSERVRLAREALATERAADAAVDGILESLGGLDDAAMDRVLERLVGLLNVPQAKVTQLRAVSEAPKVETFKELPAAVQGGARLFKKASGLPEAAVCARVMGWVEACGEEAVRDAFEAMRQERPSHELSFLQQRLNVA